MPANPASSQYPLADFAPALVGYTREVLFGQMRERPQLPPRDRSLITVATLTAGGHTGQLDYHLRRARDNGLTEDELIEAITHLAFYAGSDLLPSLLAVLAARHHGAGTIIAMSRHEPRQKLATEFGATTIITERGDDAVTAVRDMTGGTGADDEVLRQVQAHLDLEELRLSGRPVAQSAHPGRRQHRSRHHRRPAASGTASAGSGIASRARSAVCRDPTAPSPASTRARPGRLTPGLPG